MPDAALAVIAGEDVRRMVGQTFLLSSTDDEGWPHLSFLSAGEVLAVSKSHIRLALYGDSGTARAIASTGKALLTIVIPELIFKIRLKVSPLGTIPGVARELAAFECEVDSCRQDQVSYARILHGIEYVLDDEDDVVQRWEEQLRYLRDKGPR